MMQDEVLNSFSIVRTQTFIREVIPGVDEYRYRRVGQLLRLQVIKKEIKIGMI